MWLEVISLFEHMHIRCWWFPWWACLRIPSKVVVMIAHWCRGTSLISCIRGGWKRTKARIVSIALAFKAYHKFKEFIIILDFSIMLSTFPHWNYSIKNKENLIVRTIHMHTIYKPKINSNRINTVPRQRRQKLDRLILSCKRTGPIVVITQGVFRGVDPTGNAWFYLTWF